MSYLTMFEGFEPVLGLFICVFIVAVGPLLAMLLVRRFGWGPNRK